MRAYVSTIGAVVFGCALVVAALVLSDFSLAQFSSTNTSPERTTTPRWVYGNPRAETTIVEFSDFECPFCARVHPIIKRLVDESGGTVKWEFRHLPLPIHRNAEPAALAAECVGRLAGNDQFWEFTNRVFADQTLVPASAKVAADILGDEAALTACLSNTEVVAAVAADAASAAMYGGTGTPFSLVSQPDGSWKPVTGALPYENWKPFLNRE